MAPNGHASPATPTTRTMLSALREAVRASIVVMLNLPDVLSHRRTMRTAWVEIPDDPSLAYGYGDQPKVRFRFTPAEISRAEIVDSWLVWLRATEGKRARHRTALFNLGGRAHL